MVTAGVIPIPLHVAELLRIGEEIKKPSLLKETIFAASMWWIIPATTFFPAGGDSVLSVEECEMSPDMH